MSKISEEDADMLARKFAQQLQQARSVSDSEHYDHHRWISERIDRERERRIFWEEMRKHVAKWGMISVISSGGYAIYLGAKQMIIRGGQ